MEYVLEGNRTHAWTIATGSLRDCVHVLDGRTGSDLDGLSSGFYHWPHSDDSGYRTRFLLSGLRIGSSLAGDDLRVSSRGGSISSYLNRKLDAAVPEEKIHW